MNSGIFILGGITFLSAFVLFKISAFIYLLKDIEESKERSWLKLFLVFVVDLIILISGVIGTGILFMTLLKIAHG
jgi:apolipoprotein N-acyltransferase